LPSFDILKKISPQKSYRVAAVMSTYDLQSESVEEKFKGSIDIEDREWSIGVIHGRSGTGKSTIAKEIFKKEYFKGFKYKAETILDDMPKELKANEIFKSFN